MLQKVAVVIPCFNVKKHILEVIDKIGSEVNLIYVIDDKCPEATGDYVNSYCQDSRVKVIFHPTNRGVGGAVVSGYREAIAAGATIIIKIDGDGQMEPALIPKFIKPIAGDLADYVKGNRFFDLDLLASMPKLRLIGNALLSFVSKMCSGYWDIMDPTNGYTAIHASVLKMIPLHKLDKRYFFESDMLFRLNTVRAVVYDLPMAAKYGEEISHLKIGRVMLIFPCKYINRFFKRIFYNYFLRDFNIGSVELIVAIILISLGLIFGLYNWYLSIQRGIPATSGTVMLASLPIILGFQSLLAAINYDVTNVPKMPVHKIWESLE
ncbi:glycosyltransferase family 2 protein [Microcoleus sp. FACHB-68]|uniref:glycosyltransferase family 2 protein n=1 Tax=Microcoleus sp. FACHB-68 TaxID=2692826 RepID=UPI001689AF1F|nr:glycosyltransferase family 2 protein [Microcoleus sp. FACHB-68]MBD1937972.1 glycosyltransferase family 2 protein [Microcoleus sp. FACHB-68]